MSLLRLICSLLSSSHLPLQLSESRPTRTKRQIVVDDEDASQPHVVEPHMVTAQSPRKKNFLLVSEGRRSRKSWLPAPRMSAWHRIQFSLWVTNVKQLLGWEVKVWRWAESLCAWNVMKQVTRRTNSAKRTTCLLQSAFPSHTQWCNLVLKYCPEVTFWGVCTLLDYFHNH